MNKNFPQKGCGLGHVTILYIALSLDKSETLSHTYFTFGIRINTKVPPRNMQ